MSTTSSVRRGCSLALALSGVALLAGCRGTTSTHPPIHLNPNMDQQSRFDPQEPNPFFEDGRAMRPPVPGTVPVPVGSTDVGFLTGKQGEAFLEALPQGTALDLALLQRGRQRYDIYCAPCHDLSGMGKGTVVARGMLPPPSFHDARLRSLPVGQLFDVITHGVRNMPPYGPQIPPADRWAIAAYVRTLQRSRIATAAQVPPEVASEKGWKQ